MTIEEIFNSREIRDIEERIIHLYERKHPCDGKEDMIAIDCLLHIRKKWLDSVYTPKKIYTEAVSEFAHSIYKQIVFIKDKSIEFHETRHSGRRTEAYFWIHPDYSSIHPIQTLRARKIWKILYHQNIVRNKLNYSQGDWVHRFECDEDSCTVLIRPEMSEEEKQAVYLLSNFYRSSVLSMFDIIWIRNFQTYIYDISDSDMIDNLNIPLDGYKDESINYIYITSNYEYRGNL